MAALDTPWLLAHMSTPKPTPRGDVDGATSSHSEIPSVFAPPTYASFSPANLSSASSAAKRRSTILVHQKSPLLLATPPQITRALAYSHPFLLPLNKCVGLLTWTTGDPWESFLLLVAFWAVVQYGDVVLRLAGPLVVLMGIIGGMYGRRYSPLSSSGWTEHPSPANDKKKNTAASGASGGVGAVGAGHQRNASEVTSTRHQKTLDEIVDTLKVFTTRCNILLEPLLEMTDFLSTQRTATSATTRPALTTMFMRLLAITPIWVALTLPPLRIITTKRVMLLFGTILLTWHSRVCRVSRTLLWRSATVRRLSRWITGLQFEEPIAKPKPGAESINANGGNSKPAQKGYEAAKISTSALTEALKRSRSGAKDSGVRFTFILYENQRRWLGLGWTNNLLAYERAAWTDEHNNAVPHKDNFELPEVDDDGPARWRWVEGSKWRVDGAPDFDEEADYDTDAAKMGWIFYDNKWQNGRRGADGWGRWTRRRKWYRDAELIEKVPMASADNDANNNRDNDDKVGTPSLSSSPPPPALPARPALPASKHSHSSTAALSTSSDMERDAVNGKSRQQPTDTDDAASVLSSSSKSGRFSLLRRRAPAGLMANSNASQNNVNSGGSGSHHHHHHHGHGHHGSHRTRRMSETASLRSNGDDEGTTLTPALELEIQGRGKEQGQWGIGDEAQMGLE
ncbi:Pex24p-domain-containing protein [Biscogniauxia sp. FL1348]|nr:Pex24p-domain-containing protein [Biscogniauxia sp. FL1348]